MAEEIVNRVAKSGLQTLDLAEFGPDKPIVTVDLKDFLFQGMILKEKDFRKQVKEQNWEEFKGNIVSIYCSNDKAIIPIWAYMTISSKLSEHDIEVFHGNENEARIQYYKSKIDQINPADYEDAKLVIKGCGDVEVPPAAFMYITNKLQAHAKILMYGEPCSTVPVYKRRK